MAKVFCSKNMDGGISITRLPPNKIGDNSTTLTKTAFELSRTTDLTTPFDPKIHTMDSISRGLIGHRAFTFIEIDDSDLPIDRYFRDAWELSN